MSLERSLVLSRFLHSLFGAEDFEELKGSLESQEEGPSADGQSYFFHVLAGRAEIRIPQEKLAEYDARIMAYEARLAQARRNEPLSTFKYFQYIALLYSEIFLDRLTADPTLLLSELNLFRASIPDFADVPDFERQDLRRLAFFMATGSGKTLIMHVNIWQVLHYLENGADPEALVNRPDGRREFDNIILITPGEGLSDQHLAELKDSSFDASRFIEDKEARGLFGPKVKVIEIHKLAEEASAEGVSIPLKEIGEQNLIIVDEGHKGASSEARTWKTRQQALSSNGFLLEYSATFAQAIGAASPAARKALLAEYGKAILFDYSYRYFYSDGYGKTFRVLNLKKAGPKQAHNLMVGGLLVFYQQSMLFRGKRDEFSPYNVEKPLWVLLGSSVSKKKAGERDLTEDAKQERTDVAEVVAFLRRFLEEPEWAVGQIQKVLEAKSGFQDKDSSQDLFQEHISALKGERPDALYRRICRELLHGLGGLEVWELKASGEIGLRVTASGGKDLPYFAVINIGDVPSFKKHLHEKMKLEVKEDRFTGSLFDEVSRPDSPISMLIGAKKFIEGWSSWRVSSMGLLNVGKGEGSQVIQLFGRGVRLKGKNKSLKRSEVLPPPHPDGLHHLETLYIFGWNADYIQIFREILEREDLTRELPPLRLKLQTPWPDWLLVPAKAGGYDSQQETWVLDDSGPAVSLDLTPQVIAVGATADGPTLHSGVAGTGVPIRFNTMPYSGIVDFDALFTGLVAYKTSRNYGNTFIPRNVLPKILQSRCEVRMLLEEAAEPPALQRAALRVLRSYLDRFVRLKEREAESAHAVPAVIDRETQVIREYAINVYADSDGEKLIKQIEALIKNPVALMQDGGDPLPRLYIDWHLFNPILAEGKKAVTIRPPALVKSELDLARRLKEFWNEHYTRPPYDSVEVFLLRNLPKVGIGLFSRSGFYPDFILWIKNKKMGAVHVRFLDPHGLHHGGLSGNADRFEALRKLESLGKEKSFKTKKLTLDGYVLAPSGTSPEKIPGAEGKSWAELERDYPLLHQEGSYVEKVMALPSHWT